MAKRLFDICFALLGGLLLSPLLLLTAVVVLCRDGRPVLFRQRRVGLEGRPFRIVKFRTMVPRAEALGGGVTQDGDPRITRLGRLLRKTKLDELPQLWNVLMGDMSFVGPRPEVPRYADHYTAEQKRVLRLKPGITDLASILYRREEELLSGRPDVERFYLEEILPRKIRLNLAYARHASLWEDVKIILRTILPGIPCRSRAERPGEEVDPVLAPPRASR